MLIDFEYTYVFAIFLSILTLYFLQSKIRYYNNKAKLLAKARDHVDRFYKASGQIISDDNATDDLREFVLALERLVSDEDHGTKAAHELIEYAEQAIDFDNEEVVRRITGDALTFPPSIANDDLQEKLDYAYQQAVCMILCSYTHSNPHFKEIMSGIRGRSILLRKFIEIINKFLKEREITANIPYQSADISYNQSGQGELPA